MMFSNQVIIVSIIALFMMSTSSGFCPRSSSSSSSSSSTASASASSTTTQLHYISPQDIASTASTASKHLINVVVTTRIPTDVEVQILSDSSHAFMDFPSLFTGSSNNNKNSTGSSKKKTSTLLASPLRMKYAQFVGRLLWLSCGLVPNHGFHIEEIMIQLVLLGVNMRPILRSMILLKCINSGDKSNCAEECELELEEFLGINTTDSDSEDVLEYNNFLH